MKEVYSIFARQRQACPIDDGSARSTGFHAREVSRRVSGHTRSACVCMIRVGPLKVALLTVSLELVFNLLHIK